MDYTEILLSVATSGLTAGIVVFAAKRLIERSVEHLFHEREAKLDAQITAKITANDKWFERELKAYPEAVELVYRCRNAARECMNKEVPDSEEIRNFVQLTDNLSDLLFKDRMIFSNEIFEQLHSYKREVSQFAANLNFKAKSYQNIGNGEAAREIIQKELDKRWIIIDETHKAIISDIKNLIQRKTQI